MKSNRSLIALSLIGSTLGLTACSVKQKLDDMHDATIAMPEKLDQMQKTTCTMYRSLRQGNAKVSRDQDFQDIRSAKTLPAKLAEAAEYMQGFEYQVWTTDCETDLPRADVIEQFAKELLAKMQGFTEDREVVSPTKTNDHMETLYALAATLHYTNALQKSMLDGSKYAVLRPFDILVSGLEIDRKKNLGTLDQAEIPAYAEVIGKYSKDAVYLLRLRQNFLMAYAYALADSNEVGNAPNSIGKILRVVKTTILNKAWTPKLQNRTATEIDERITAALEYAVETNAALVKLGVDPMMDPMMVEMWSRADFSKMNVEGLSKSSALGDRVFAESVKHLISARDRVVSARKKTL